jgi:Ser/Thr protein kinase RdoA (MazF antagonist)
MLYALEVAGEPCMVAARVFPAGTDVRAIAKIPPPGQSLLRTAFTDEENNAVYWTFPHDRKIKNLSFLMSAHGLCELVQSRWTRSRLVAYAPEKCATVQCMDDEGSVLAYAKCYAGNESFQAFRRYIELVPPDSGQFAVPRVLAYSSSLHILVLQAIEGKRIADLQGDELEQGVHAMGRALGSFHSTPVNAEMQCFTRLDPDHLQEAAATIAFVRPEAAFLVQRLTERLCSTYMKTNSPAVRVHGDVHPKNGLLCGGRVIMIDLDQAGLAPAAADLGSFLAALRYEVITRSLPQARESVLAEAFLAGYATAANLPRVPELQWHVAAALLSERALRSVSRVRVEGLENMENLLQAAMDALEQDQLETVR